MKRSSDFTNGNRHKVNGASSARQDILPHSHTTRVHPHVASPPPLRSLVRSGHRGQMLILKRAELSGETEERGCRTVRPSGTPVGCVTVTERQVSYSPVFYPFRLLSLCPVCEMGDPKERRRLRPKRPAMASGRGYATHPCCPMPARAQWTTKTSTAKKTRGLR